MKAMLLAAGEGRRMLPLTRLRPKPALHVLGRPLLIQILYRLARHGVSEVVVNLHHRPEVLRRVVEDESGPGLPTVHFSVEPMILGTAGGIRRAAELLRDSGPVLVWNADFLADIDIGRVLESHRRNGTAATLVLAPPRPGYSAVEVDDDGGVLSLAGDPPAEASQVAGRHLFTGCHVIEEEVIDRVPPKGPSDIVRDVYRALAVEGRLGSILHPGFWWEFGSPGLLLDGTLRLLACDPEAMHRISGVHDPVRAIGDARVALGPGATHHRSTRLRGGVALGYASLISEGCEIEDSIVMPEAWIGPNCSLRRCVVGQGAEVPAGLTAECEVICPDPDPIADPPTGSRRIGGLMAQGLDVAEGR